MNISRSWKSTPQVNSIEVGVDSMGKDEMMNRENEILKERVM